LGAFSGSAQATVRVAQALFVSYEGLRFALAVLLAAAVTAQPARRLVVFPFALACVNSVFYSPFPWYFAGSVSDAPLWMQTAEFGGVASVDVVVASMNSVVAAWLPPRSGNWRLPTLVSGGLVAASLLFGAARIKGCGLDERAPFFATLGLIQANVDPMDKRNAPTEGLDRHLRLVESLGDPAAFDLILWSETAVATPVPDALADRYFRNAFLKGLRAPLLFGAIVSNGSDPGSSLSNAAFLSDRRGDVVGRYKKRVLLLGAERAPSFVSLESWHALFPSTLDFVAGSDPAPLQLGDKGLAMTICLEDMFPRVVRASFERGKVNLIVNLTNDGWFGETYASRLHFAMSKFRAIEHRRYLVRVTNTGVTAVVDPVGRVDVMLDQHEEIATAARIEWRRGRTVYAAVGDAPWFILMSTLVGIGCVRSCFGWGR